MNSDSVFPFMNPQSAYVQQVGDRQKDRKPRRPLQRKNNRRNTPGRYTQYITEQIPGTFPPKFRTKCIKHSN